MSKVCKKVRQSAHYPNAHVIPNPTQNTFVETRNSKQVAQTTRICESLKKIAEPLKQSSNGQNQKVPSALNKVDKLHLASFVDCVQMYSVSDSVLGLAKIRKPDLVLLAPPQFRGVGQVSSSQTLLSANTANSHDQSGLV